MSELDSLELRVVETQPFNAETPMPALGERLTPTPIFYVRNHFPVPALDPESWRLEVGGAVERPLALSIDEVRALGAATVALTLECAGNGRTRMSPVPPGTPWGDGAVGMAVFSGTPLRRLLERARLRPEAREVLFEGADRGEVEPGRVEPFARSLSRHVALGEALLAWEMNGAPLTSQHGAPLRLVMPGWYGVASVKWLVRISALTESFGGYYQRERYVYVGERGTPDRTPVTTMRVRAVIARPAEGAELELGRGAVEVAGTAWSGAGAVRRVEVSADDGRSWTEAALGAAASAYAATPWRFTWHPPSPGTFTLLARATDEAGNTQPLEPPWNLHGYGNNAVQRVEVRIVGGRQPR